MFVKIVSVALFLAVLVGLALGSSHSEAPGTTRVKAADLTDVYAFRSYETGRSAYSTFILNVNPLQAPSGGPNFYAMSTEHLYYLHLDGNGDGVEDISYEFMFSHSLGGPNVTQTQVSATGCSNSLSFQTVTTGSGITLTINGTNVGIPLKYAAPISAASPNSGVNFIQQYQLSVINGLVPNGTVPTRNSVTRVGSGNPFFGTPADNAGPKTIPDYASYANLFKYDINIPSCGTAGRVFVGQRKESFSVNLGAIFDLVNMVPVAGVAGAIANDARNNALANYNIGSMILEIPNACLPNTNGAVAVWSTVRYLLEPSCPPTCPGPHVPGLQYSRLGNPLVNEVVIGLNDKNNFNLNPPTKDGAFANYVLYPTLPEILDSLFKGALNNGNRIAPTNFPRTDLVQAFLLGVPGLNQLSSTLFEALRLNFSVPATVQASQNPLGVIAGDNAGFPNGRRPGDDVVDIALDVVMGRLCTIPGVVTFGGGCTAAAAPTGTLSFLDGAPQNANQFDAGWPYLTTPLPGFTANVIVVTATSTTGSSASSAAEMPTLF